MTRNLIPLMHEPAMPPRDDIIGEIVYTEAWQRFMSMTPASFDDISMLESILKNYIKHVDQREATVCASVICWLGTNLGRSFLSLCSRVDSDATFNSGEQAYLAAWAIENRRTLGSNNGIRVLEHCLSTAKLEPCPSGIGAYRPRVELSAEDYECAEGLIQWLGGSDGKKFTSYCETEIELRSKKPSFPFKELSGLGEPA